VIKVLDNGVKVVELGKGTTFISQVFVDGDTISSGICFSNQVPNNGELKGDEVIIEITNMKGAVSYIKALVDLLKTWEIEELKDQIENLDRTINMMLHH
jgi:hypothetical protein